MAKNNKRYIISVWDRDECNMRYLFAVYIRDGMPELDIVDCNCREELARLPSFAHCEAHCLCAFLQSFARKEWTYRVMPL